tara:strand:- start:29089 stop:29508 length:420 start_codon:yes stop_codon:yes gene_type:complete
MKLNVKPNPGWTNKTVGKLNTWQDLANTAGNASTVYSAEWEPSSAKLGNVHVTYGWSAAVVANLDLDLYGTYDGTNYVHLANIGTQIKSDGTNGGDAAGTLSAVIDLSSYPAGKYKVAGVYSGNDASDTFDVFITEQEL